MTVFLSSAYLFYRDRSFFGFLTFCPARSVVLSILCCDNLMCVYWRNYVATLTIVLRHYFCAASSNLCHDSISVGSCCNNVSCIVSISVATRKVCRDRVLSPLNLISCCSFISMLRHCLCDVDVFCHNQFFMSR